MRTTDPDPVPFKPLGEKVEKARPAPPVLNQPVGKSGIVTDADGKIRTTSHRPHGYPVEIWSYLP
jgi:hypothetical protein